MSFLLSSHLRRRGLWDLESLMLNQNCSKRRLEIPTLQQSPVNVLALRFGQSWVFVEQIGNKSEVEFGVSVDDISWGDKLSTAQPVGLLQHGFCPLHIIFLLSTHRQNTHAGVKRSGTAATTCSGRMDGRAYIEACHVDVDAWLILFHAFWRDLIKKVEIGSGVLEEKKNKYVCK